MHVVSALGWAAVSVHLFAAVTVVAALFASPVSANEALQWNDTTVRAAIVGGQNGKFSRPARSPWCKEPSTTH